MILDRSHLANSTAKRALLGTFDTVGAFRDRYRATQDWDDAAALDQERADLEAQD